MGLSEKDRLIMLGLKVGQYRKLAGLSVPMLSDKAGISVSMIEKIEAPSNLKAVSLRVLWRISDALGIHISKLLKDE